jgi:hypothetical protein
LRGASSPAGAGIWAIGELGELYLLFHPKDEMAELLLGGVFEAIGAALMVLAMCSIYRAVRSRV